MKNYMNAMKSAEFGMVLCHITFPNAWEFLVTKSQLQKSLVTLWETVFCEPRKEICFNTKNHFFLIVCHLDTVMYTTIQVYR